MAPFILDDSSDGSSSPLTTRPTRGRPTHKNKNKPAGILRPSTYRGPSPPNAPEDDDEDEGDRMPSHWPLTAREAELPFSPTDDRSSRARESSPMSRDDASQGQDPSRDDPSQDPSQDDASQDPSQGGHSPARRRARFPPPHSVVTSVALRPRTDLLDIPDLYYSAADVRGFKRERREEIRPGQGGPSSREGEEEGQGAGFREGAASVEGTSHEVEGEAPRAEEERPSVEMALPGPEETIRTPSSAGLPLPDDELEAALSDSNDEPPEPSPEPGIFSSIMDVFGTGGGRGETTVVHLVDTLYLY